jgi:hypothetical protein
MTSIPTFETVRNALREERDRVAERFDLRYLARPTRLNLVAWRAMRLGPEPANRASIDLTMFTEPEGKDSTALRLQDHATRIITNVSVSYFPYDGTLYPTVLASQELPPERTSVYHPHTTSEYSSIDESANTLTLSEVARAVNLAAWVQKAARADS